LVFRFQHLWDVFLLPLYLTPPSAMSGMPYEARVLLEGLNAGIEICK
jgi:hypothetical protein